jgi:hypothetical protein
MRINEIILEDEQLDELSLKGLGTGIGKVPGAIAGGVVQGAKNIWQGAKQGYAAGQAALAPDSQPAPAASGSAPATSVSGQSPAPAASGSAPATSVSGQSAGTQAKGQSPAGSQSDNPVRYDPEFGGYTQAGPSAVDPGPEGIPPAQRSGSSTPATSVSGSAPAVRPLKAAEIVTNLDKVWKTATADQGSETTSPRVQQQIRAMAKNAGLAGQTVESEISLLKKLSGI